jgi:hypothetical protein
LHQGTVFSAEEVADLAELIQQAVYELYVEPARREAMRKAREDRRVERATDNESQASSERDDSVGQSGPA